MTGVVVAVDVGTVRVGVAASDPHRILASPVETVPAPGHARVLEICAERAAVLLVVGLPTSLAGTSTSASADMARAWVAQLDTELPVELVDERLTTVTATAALRASGRKADRRLIDQAAAVALLQGYLDRH
ncbi:MAG: putative pre6S rRNA nuclease [Frankiales bacterium]|nr:putative pre6S rRNA nuclease [Frankiales bacterium]